jgi:hypothetical protein
MPAAVSTLGESIDRSKGHPDRACCIHNPPVKTSAVAIADARGAPMRWSVVKGVI